MHPSNRGQRGRHPSPASARGGRGPGLAALVACLLLFAGCDDYPRDPEGTLERVRGGTLRAGVVAAPPWVVLQGGQALPSGPEPLLVTRIADSVDARVEWQQDSVDALMERLSRYELDLVVAGLTADTAFKRDVALSIPHATVARGERTVAHVLALPPGENAWQMQVEAVLRDASGDAP